MQCPKCGCDNDKVIDSRSLRDGIAVRRRRECGNCAYRFTTLETIVPEELKVVKRDGSREEFDREKVRIGIANACYKRPISDDDIDHIVSEVTASLLHDFDKEVDSYEIGSRVMQALRQHDEVAYIRFASVYRKFRDVSDFISEVKGLKK